MSSVAAPAPGANQAAVPEPVGGALRRAEGPVPEAEGAECRQHPHHHHAGSVPPPTARAAGVGGALPGPSPQPPAIPRSPLCLCKRHVRAFLERACSAVWEKRVFPVGLP